MRKLLIGLTVLLVAGSVMVSAAVPTKAALEIPKVATGPTSYSDAVWGSAPSWTANQASKGSTWYEINLGTAISDDADCSATVKMLWDSTNLYALVSVTDDVHADQRGTNNLFNNDSIEFYLDANNSKGVSYGPQDSQDTVGYKDGAITIGNSQINSPTSQFNGTISGGNYTLMGKWAWVGTGAGQLGLSSAPSVDDLIGFGICVNESDNITAGEFSGRDSGMTFWVDAYSMWSDASLFPTFTLTPEPATMALLGLGGLGLLVRRKRR